MAVSTLRLRPRLRYLGPGVWQTQDRRFTIAREGRVWIVEGEQFRTLTEAAIAIVPRLQPLGPFYRSDVGWCYLLHLERPFRHARHYLGWTAAESVYDRIERHRAGAGANFLRHVNDAGIGYELVRVWPGGRVMERRLKNRGGASRLCPVCRAERAAERAAA